jgi:hypothetical protein
MSHSFKMNEVYLGTASNLFEHISENAEYYRQKMLETTTSEGQWYKYTDRDNNSQEISFAGNRSANVELSLKIKGRWVPWVYVNDSTIENGGKGLFCSKNFALRETAMIYMGRKLTSEELNNNDFSKYAMADVDPCDRRRNMTHWFYLSQYINHGNYTVANICFETNLVAHYIKPLSEDMELFVDYQRPIYCKKCVEYRKVAGTTKLRRVETKVSAKGDIGNCNRCKPKTEKLLARECKKCHKKLCIDCYDYFQISL